MSDLVKVSVDLGSGRSASFAWFRGTLRHAGLPCGVLVKHQPWPTVAGHVVTVLWAGEQPVVGLDKLEPLTLVGSFECGCGERGTIVDGRWVGEAS